jgi:hypothetical protein
LHYGEGRKKGFSTDGIVYELAHAEVSGVRYEASGVRLQALSLIEIKKGKR